MACGGRVGGGAWAYYYYYVSIIMIVIIMITSCITIVIIIIIIIMIICMGANGTWRSGEGRRLRLFLLRMIYTIITIIITIITIIITSVTIIIMITIDYYDHYYYDGRTWHVEVGWGAAFGLGGSGQRGGLLKGARRKQQFGQWREDGFSGRERQDLQLRNRLGLGVADEGHGHRGGYVYGHLKRDQNGMRKEMRKNEPERQNKKRERKMKENERKMKENVKKVKESETKMKQK
jgi:hypothetical protein